MMIANYSPEEMAADARELQRLAIYVKAYLTPDEIRGDMRVDRGERKRTWEDFAAEIAEYNDDVDRALMDYRDRLNHIWTRVLNIGMANRLAYRLSRVYTRRLQVAGLDMVEVEVDFVIPRLRDLIARYAPKTSGSRFEFFAFDHLKRDIIVWIGRRRSPVSVSDNEAKQIAFEPTNKTLAMKGEAAEIIDARDNPRLTEEAMVALLDENREANEDG